MVHVPRVEYNRTLHLGEAGGRCTWYFDPSLPAHPTVSERHKRLAEMHDTTPKYEGFQIKFGAKTNPYHVCT